MQEILLLNNEFRGIKLYFISGEFKKCATPEIVAYVLHPKKFQHPLIFPHIISQNGKRYIGERTIGKIVLVEDEINHYKEYHKEWVNDIYEIVKYFLSDDAGINYGLRNPFNIDAAIKYRRGELRIVNSELLFCEPHMEQCSFCLENYSIKLGDIVVLDCYHLFHRNCIETNGIFEKCPLCYWDNNK